MIVSGNGTICGLPSFVGISRNDTAAYINDIFLAVVNGSCAIFAFLCNLAFIVLVIKKPSLQKRSNILLCSLAFADCLTGITSQPMFVVWRFFLQRSQQSCLHQVLIFDVYYTLNFFTVGLSFVNILTISFDRHYSLSSPLVYLSNSTKEGAIKIVVFANVLWFLCAILVLFVLRPSLAEYIATVLFGVLFVVVPAANYMRMLFAIRRHNSQLGDVIASQHMTVVLQREKKMALDMWIVAILLLASLAPAFFIKILEFRYPRVHSIAFPWSLTMSMITSSINPVYYFGRNKHLREALTSMINI